MLLKYTLINFKLR